MTNSTSSSGIAGAMSWALTRTTMLATRRTPSPPMIRLVSGPTRLRVVLPATGLADHLPLGLVGSSVDAAGRLDGVGVDGALEASRPSVGIQGIQHPGRARDGERDDGDEAHQGQQAKKGHHCQPIRVISPADRKSTRLN